MIKRHKKTIDDLVAEANHEVVPDYHIDLRQNIVIDTYLSVLEDCKDPIDELIIMSLNSFEGSATNTIFETMLCKLDKIC